jgi:hypothetical protein
VRGAGGVGGGLVAACGAVTRQARLTGAVTPTRRERGRDSARDRSVLQGGTPTRRERCVLQRGERGCYRAQATEGTG